MKKSKNIPAKESKSEETDQLEKKQTPGNDIAQPDPNAEDNQAYIKENAKKGESVYVPNVVGHNPVTHKLDEEK